MTIDPEKLAAYADGELSAEEAAKVEAAIAADPTLAREVEAHRALRAQLSAHFDPILSAPVPGRLTALLAPKESAQVIDLGAVRRAKEKEAQLVPASGPPRWRLAGALAASLALGIVLNPLIFPEGSVSSDGQGLVARGGLADALSTQLASAQEGKDVRILLSFRAKDGHYCRGFEQGATAGIACNQDGSWRIIRTQGGAPVVNGQGGYVQAGSQATEIMAVAQDMADGAAFDSDAESRARAAGWTRN